ncbi:hypothetical protein RB195_009024 [Necator americanus]|uniref:SXP/RAL-2 family protein Ani s 5-like cation-binding domain-containing protein n=1 Tax=Necator americanus TaxID=51031 RepID=A0ABR1CSW2_NECAM
MLRNQILRASSPFFTCPLIQVKQSYCTHQKATNEEHLPSFLRNVTKESRDEFFEIVQNRKIPRRELKENVKKWAQKQEKSVLEEMHKFDASQRARFAEVHKKVNLVINQLPKAHEEVHKIVTNDSLSKEEMFEKFRAIDVDPVVDHLRCCWKGLRKATICCPM